MSFVKSRDFSGFFLLKSIIYKNIFFKSQHKDWALSCLKQPKSGLFTGETSKKIVIFLF